MVSFKAVVYSHQQRKDGTYNVKLRLTHKRKSINLPTTMTVGPEDLTRKLKFKSARSIKMTSDLVSDMWRCLDGVSQFVLDQMSAEDVVALIKKKERSASGFRLDFISFGEQWVESRSVTGGTKAMYYNALHSLQRWKGGELDVNAITLPMLKEWADCVVRDGLSPNTLRQYVYLLNRIFQECRDRYNDEDVGHILIPRDPFRKLTVKAVPRTPARALSVEEIQSLIDCKGAGRSKQKAIDLFLLSFLLMGMNYADLEEPKTIENGWIVYHRKKVRKRRMDKAEMHVKVPECAAPILERLESGETLIGCRIPSADMENIHLRDFYRSVGMKKFSFGSARHSWATLARKAGVEKATVDECLCHVGDLRVADMYIERDWELMNKANEKVLALFRWK